MVHLSLALLGPLEVRLGERLVTAFESAKVRALLAYLAVEAQRPHPREALAALLWPDWPDRAALTNLRNALANLRACLGDGQANPAYLLITRETIQFNRASDHDLDVATLLAATRVPTALPQAVELYRGPFLEGLAVADSAPFEEWATRQREHLAQELLAALGRLAADGEQRGDYDLALRYAQRQLALDPAREEAHQQAMRALALAGQRSAALAQYQACCAALAQELGVEPARETTTLYEHIRQGALGGTTAALSPREDAPLPAFLRAGPPALPERPPFVAREEELARLEEWLGEAFAGQGRVAFVTGEAGSGKTMLLHEFARQAMAEHADLIVASGNCNAYTGVGDPYLPFSEALGLLAGDIEMRLASGALAPEHAQRLQRNFPAMAQALANVGPDLVNVFVSGEALLQRAQPWVNAPWRARLEALAQRQGGMGALSQTALLEQATRVLQTLAREHPLLLLLDDLQWADSGSLNLLFHLGRKLAGSRILVLGAYRPEEVALGRNGERHPLEPLVSEFRRTWGEIVVDLAQAEGRVLVEALVDREPNRLGAAFRETILHHTGGHALFTVEVLHELRERGDLRRDDEGRWVEGPALAWERLPARVEAVIGESMARLPSAERRLLEVASVEGEEFTAEAVARARGMAEVEVIERLSGSLSHAHALVRAQSVQRVGEQTLSSYRFRHILFQNYLYQHLDPVRRTHLHGQVGHALEALYGAIPRPPLELRRILDERGSVFDGGMTEVSPIALPLARQFEAAGVRAKAVAYYFQAAVRAMRLLALREAITHATQGLRLLSALPPSREKAQAELPLQFVLGKAHEGHEGPASPKRHMAYARAQALAEELGDTDRWLGATGCLADIMTQYAKHREAVQLLERMLEVAERESPSSLPIVYTHLAMSLTIAGRHAEAWRYLEPLAAPYLQGSSQKPPRDVPHALCVGAISVWVLGYPDRALRLTQIAGALAYYPQQAMLIKVMENFVRVYRREPDIVLAGVEALLPDATEEHYRIARHWLSEQQGWAHIHTGQVSRGIAEMRAADTAFRQGGHLLRLGKRRAWLAEGYLLAMQYEDGLQAIAEGLDHVVRTDDHYSEPELYRLKGELLRQRGDDPEEVEASFRQAIAVAQAQEAKSWELRATTSLARLLHDQGRGEEAHQMLAAIYGWFTEGFDTPDLQEARALLEEWERR
jgi:DNA-binding SARP family transcriptional activator